MVIRDWVRSVGGAVRPIVVVSGGIAASTIAVVIAIAAPGGGGGPGTANIFVDANGGTCSRSGVANTYSDPAACGSLDAANDICQNGDVVLIESGTYPNQTITGSDSRTSMCTMQAATAGTVTMTGKLKTEGDWLTLKNATVNVPTGSNGGWVVDFGNGERFGNHITFDHVDVTGPEATVQPAGGSAIIWQNSNMGTSGNTTARSCSVGNGEPIQVDATNGFTLTNIDIWQFFPDLNPVACGSQNGQHLEDVRIDGDSSNVRVDQVRFHKGSGDGSARLFISGSNISNVTVVNSWLGLADGHDGNPSNGIDLSNVAGACPTITFAYDTVAGGINDPCLPHYYGMVAGGLSGCQGSARNGNLWVWNIDYNGTCPSSSDVWLVDTLHTCAAATPADVCMEMYKFAADSYHLTATSPNISTGGETTQCAALTGGVDIDGLPRAHTNPCEPGADEFGN